MKNHGPLQNVTGVTGGSAPGAHRKPPARTARARAARRILVSALAAASLGSAAAMTLGHGVGGQAPVSTHQSVQMPATMRGPWMLAVTGGRAPASQP